LLGGDNTPVHEIIEGTKGSNPAEIDGLGNAEVLLVNRKDLSAWRDDLAEA
jgi:hypothetical protein